MITAVTIQRLREMANGESYYERIVRMQILKVRGESRDCLLEKRNTKPSESKLIFNISYYSVFQNVRIFLQELEVFASTI